jgi:Tol biopolymer transport system component
VNPDGTDLQTQATLPTPSFTGYAQSPTSASLVAFGHTTDVSTTPKYALFSNSSVTMTGATPLTTAQFYGLGSIQFTPDGSRVVFTGAVGSTAATAIWGLYVVNSNGTGGLTKLDDADDASLSPTGTRVVYTRFRSNDPDAEICARNLDGTGFTQLTNNSIDDLLPQYSKDGTKIVFTSDRTGTFEIHTMTSTGTSQTRVTFDADTNYGASLNQDASEVAYARISLSASESGVYRKPATSTPSTNQIRQTQSIGAGVYWSPNSALKISSVGGEAAMVPATSDRVLRRLGLIP